MIQNDRQRRFCNRSLMAIVFAFLFLIKCLALAIAPSFMGKSHGLDAPFVAALGLNENCDASRDAAAPIQRHHDHSQNCMSCTFCAAGGRDILPLFVAVLLGVHANPSSTAAFSIASYFSGERRGDPIGWTSTWSSRAPPTFS
jgi:hypothetical protein